MPAPHWASLLLLLSSCAGAAPPATPPTPVVPPVERPATPRPPQSPAEGSSSALEELRAWVAAVESDDIEQIVARVNGPVTFRAKAMLDRPPVEDLDRASLRAALAADQARLLGLHKDHLLPRPGDLVETSDGRMSAVDPRCPSVTWIFENRNARWFLDEVVVTLLEC